MISASEIRQSVQDYLDNKMSLQALADWSASHSWNIQNDPNVEARDLAYSLRGSLVECLSGDLDEQALRAELESTVLPFAPRAELVSVAVYVGQSMTFGEPVILSGNNSVPIFRKPPGRYIRAFAVRAEGRTHSAYTYAPMGNAYGFGYPLKDPDLATEVLPLHAQPA